MTRTPTWLLCVAVVGVVVPLIQMFRATNNASIDNFERLKEHIRPPWLLSGYTFGIDVSDTQWSVFIGIFPFMGPSFALFAIVARYLRQFRNPALLQWYYVIVGVGFLFFLHGTTVAFMLAIQIGNFFFATCLVSRVSFPAYQLMSWSVHVILLYVNYVNSGYSFGMLSPSLSFVDTLIGSRLRWHVVYNMSVLRMIAFNYDLYDSLNSSVEKAEKLEKQHPSACLECAVQTRGAACCYKYRTDAARPASDFNLRTYMSFMCYIPLYVAGPMSSFNAFVSYTVLPTNIFSLRDSAVYIVRIVFTFLAVSLELHFAYINAIFRTPGVFETLNTTQKASTLFLTLSFLWMKFRIIWRVARLIAIVDGVEVPEDMPKCFANTTTVQNFWKDWHASFNLWIVRYMYIPLGGGKRRIFSVFPIFIFIAFWHDIELRLFSWALVMCVAFVPEVLVTLYFSSPSWKHLPQSPLFIYLRAVGGAASISLLVLANCVGYGAGIATTTQGTSEIFSLENFTVAAAGLAFFFFASILSWNFRDAADDARKQQLVLFGINRASSDPVLA